MEDNLHLVFRLRGSELGGVGTRCGGRALLPSDDGGQVRGRGLRGSLRARLVERLQVGEFGLERCVLRLEGGEALLRHGSGEGNESREALIGDNEKNFLRISETTPAARMFSGFGFLSLKASTITAPRGTG